MCNEITNKPVRFCGLYKPLIDHIFKFLNRQDQAIVTVCCSLFRDIKDINKRNFYESEVIYWKKMINSQERICAVTFDLFHMKICNDYLSFTAIQKIQCKEIDNRYFLNLTDLSICKEKVERFYAMQKGGSIDERVTAGLCYYTDAMSRFVLVDNVERSEIYRVIFPGMLIGVKALRNKHKNSMELITDDGWIRRYDLNLILSNEEDNKKRFEKCETIWVIPSELNQWETENEVTASFLLDAYYVKSLYYFQWHIIKKGIKTKVITLLKDINFPRDHVKLELNSDTCSADDHFFYTSFQNQIKIYSGDKVWKKFEIECAHLNKVILNPTPYGLAVEYHVRKDDVKFPYLSIWDQNSSISEERIPPFFSQEIDSTEVSSYFSSICVRSNLVFYKQQQKWWVYHIPSREIIGCLNFPDREIVDIEISGEICPKYLIAYCINPSDIKEKAENRRADFRIISLENTYKSAFDPIQ